MFNAAVLSTLPIWKEPQVDVSNQQELVKLFPINEPFRDFIKNNEKELLVTYIVDQIGEVAEIPFYVEALYECMEGNNYEMAAVLLQHWGNHSKYIDDGTYPYALILCSPFFPLSLVRWLSTIPLLSNRDSGGNKRSDVVPMLYEKVMEASLMVENVLLGDRLRGCQMITSLYESAPDKGDDLTIEDIDRLLTLITEDLLEIGDFLTEKKKRLVGDAPVPKHVINDSTIEWSTQAYSEGKRLYLEELSLFSQKHKHKQFPELVRKDFKESVRVTQLLGPLNVSDFYITDPEHPCSVTGGCRMMYCIHNDYTEEDEQEDTSDLPIDLTAKRWFKGYCMHCLHKIENPGSCIRLPLINIEAEGNGWYGCYCSEKCATNCVSSSGDPSLIGADAYLIMKFNPKIGIIQRKVGI